MVNGTEEKGWKRDRWQEVVSLQGSAKEQSLAEGGVGCEDNKVAASMNKLKGISCGTHSRWEGDVVRDWAN